MKPALMRNIILDCLILTSWFGCVGMVIMHERGYLFGNLSNPAASLGATIESKEQWFGVYYQNQKVGFSQMTLMPEDHNGIPGVALIDRGRLSFNLLGSPQRLEINTRAFIDADWRLQKFDASISTSDNKLHWDGQRLGDELVVRVSTPSSSVTKRFKDPKGSTFVNGLSSWVAFHRLRVGQSGRIWVINPLALNPEPLRFAVRRTEDVEGKRALVVETDVAGITTLSWVTQEGDVLKENSPLGWELRRESREEALSGLSLISSAPDILLASSVALDKPLGNPDSITRLVLLLEGIDAGSIAIRRHFQSFLSQDSLAAYQNSVPGDSWCLIQLERPKRFEWHGTVPHSVERYQRPSQFVQSDNARVIAKAKSIIGMRTDPWEKLIAINQWVHKALAKQVTVGLPTAVDILDSPVGDCHEHTVLFTGLARSVGLPTRMVAGLVYQNGRLYYHAWPEVWIGDWIPTDPTLGQVIADATHIGLSEAESESLISLGGFIGKLKAHVLHVEYDKDTGDAFLKQSPKKPDQ